MRNLVYILSIILLLSVAESKEKNISKLESAKINWKSPIGNVSFRTNISKKSNTLFIGSNGNHFMDYGLIDDGNGIYAINAINGKIKNHFQGEKFGDMDVNGVLIHDNKLFFGNDNDEFLCTDLKGNLIYRLPTSGDIEFEPVLIKRNKKNIIVYGTETGELRAINPSNGNTVWKYFHENFEGWKEGDDRTLFKVKMHFYSSRDFFFDKPVLKDVNNDDVADLIFTLGSYDIIMIDGKTGKDLYNIDINSKESINDGFYSQLWKTAPLIIEDKGKVMAIVPFRKWESSEVTQSELRCFTLNGKLIKKIKLDPKFFSSCGKRIGVNEKAVLFDRGIVDFSNGLDSFKITKFIGFPEVENNSKWYIPFSNNIASNQFIKVNNEICLLSIYENGDLIKNSTLVIISVSSGKVIKLYNLPSTSEFQPVIGDFNKDGKADVIVGCHDGILYDIDLNIPSLDILNK